jgi:protein-disulfide isomerase
MADEQSLSRSERRRLAREQAKSGGGEGSGWGRRLALWGGTLVVLGLIVWGMVVAATRPVTPATGATLLDPVTNTDWVREVAATSTTPAASSSVATLVECSDFECPACGYFAPEVKQLLADFPGQLRLVYRHFPLRSIHPNAQLAAQAAEAAGRQNPAKFWDMADTLFARQEEWATSRDAATLFTRYATNLGLSSTQFTSDLYSPLVVANVENDFTSATKQGLLGTPTFFLNGVQIQNPKSYEDFHELITEALINANAQ